MSAASELAPILSRDPRALPEEFSRGADIPENLDPLADGVLMRHQAEWIEDKSDLKLGEKGRRTGVTFAEALDETLIAATKKSAGGQNCFYIGDTKDKGREFIGYCAHFARVIAGDLGRIEEFMFEDQKPDGGTNLIAAFRIRFASGCRIEALSSRPENIRGLQGVVCIDEAAFHKDVRGVLDAVNALLIWGGKIRVISTHNGVLNPFNELIREAKAGKIPFSLHHIPFAKAVSNGLYKRVCLIAGKTWTPEGEIEWERRIRAAYGPRTAAMRQELDAIPAEAEGAALTRMQIEACMAEPAAIPIVRWSLPDEFKNLPEHVRKAECLEFCEQKLAPVLEALDYKRPHYLGQDFARSGDVSCIMIAETDAVLVRRVRLQIEMRNVPFDQQREVLFYVGDRCPRFSGGALDANGNGAYLAEKAVQRWGERILEVKASAEWYRVNGAAYVEAAQLAGIGPLAIVGLHIMPNLAPPLAVQASLNMGWAILNAAGLSFLSLGIRPPTPEWGIMVSEG
ncbi:MAG TPA: ABC transporter permease subunit, partial [Beijerinckiaceae bacterium]|nr:ABC transporter permease subunit [Beijerinckiaceae bacterium]